LYLLVSLLSALDLIYWWRATQAYVLQIRRKAMSLFSLETVAPTAVGTPTPPLTSDWKAGSIRRYQRGHAREAAILRATLAERVLALIGRSVAPDAVYVDVNERYAHAVVDGVMMRLWRSELVLVRPCAVCGVGRFESAPLRSPADVGHAMSVWRPTHEGCEPDEEFIH
jgi:hypothetical protein